MRATSMRRLVGGAAALMLVGTTLLTATAFAGKVGGTRLLYVGPNSDYKTSPGIMTFTPVSVGGQSVSTVYVKNVDNQNLTHVVITFDRVQGGATVSDVYGPSASSCLPLGTTSVTCDFGNIAAGTTRQFTLVIDATAVQNITSFAGTIVFNESTNPNGGNPQISSDSGLLPITASSCNTLTTFVLPNTDKKVLPDIGSCTGDGQRSALLIPANSNGSTVTVDDSSSEVPGTCGAYVCFGNEVSAGVNDGQTVSPYLTWLITYSPAALGNINPKQVGFQHGSDTPLTPKKDTCGVTFTGKDCIVGYTVDPATGAVTFTIWTARNSTIRGLH